MSNTNSPLQRVLALLDHPVRCGDGWLAQCPAHDDDRPSLSIGVGEGGRVLLKCFAGCTVAKIVEAMDLGMADLFSSLRPRREVVSYVIEGQASRAPATPQHPIADFTLAEYAGAKRLPLAELEALGVTDGRYQGHFAVRIPHYDANGKTISVLWRCSLHAKKGRFRRRGRAVPYGLNRVPLALALGYIVIVEGPSDVHTLWHHGEPALGLPGTSGLDANHARMLEKIETIYVVIEGDDGGNAVLAWLAKSSLRHRAFLVDLGIHKDPSGLHVFFPEMFRRTWRQALTAAVPWSETFAKRGHSRDLYASIPTTILDTVEAVESLLPEHPHGVGVRQLAPVLGRHPGTVSRRVDAAVEARFLVKTEPRRGCLAKILPTPRAPFQGVRNV